MLPHLQEGFEQERGKLSGHQSYLSPRESYAMNPDEARGWEKLAWIHQGQFILGKPDCLLAQSNLLGGYGTSGGRFLPGFQVFPCCFPQPLPRETNVLYSRQGICVLAGNWAAPRAGGEMLLLKLAACPK